MPPGYLWAAAPKGPEAPRWYFYLLAMVAFACWALGTSGPLESLIGISQTVGGVILGLGTFLIPLVDGTFAKFNL